MSTENLKNEIPKKEQEFLFVKMVEQKNAFLTQKL